MIGGSWIGKLWKFAVVPRKFAAVDDDSADGVAVSSHELCERVDHDIGAVIDRSRHVRRGEGVVYNKGQSSLMGNICNGGQVYNVTSWIADSFRENKLGLRRNCLTEVFGIVGFDELRIEAQSPHGDIELGNGSPIQSA